MSAKKSTSERILETADRLFYGQGTVVGVDTLAAEAGVSKRTLYNHYPSKDALIEAYLTRRIRLIPTSDKPPAQQILDDFDRLERAFAWEGFRGCAFVNAVAELKDPRHAANAIALRFKEVRRQWFRALLVARRRRRPRRPVAAAPAAGRRRHRRRAGAQGPDRRPRRPRRGAGAAQGGGRGRAGVRGPETPERLRGVSGGFRGVIQRNGDVRGEPINIINLR